MGLFSKKTKTIELKSPLDGKSVPITTVNDPTFNKELLGKGIAFKPESCELICPCDGKISMIFDTGHAVSIQSDNGVEILIHIGLETVGLKGKGFETFVENDQSVKEGDLLIKFDQKVIAEAGLDPITPMVICNSDDYKSFDFVTGQDVKTGDVVIKLEA